MANVLTGNPLRIDTAAPFAALVKLFNSTLFVHHFEFSKYALQGNRCQVRDGHGRYVWDITGAGDLEEVRSGTVGPVFDGMYVDNVEGGGVLSVYFK